MGRVKEREQVGACALVLAKIRLSLILLFLAPFDRILSCCRLGLEYVKPLLCSMHSISLAKTAKLPEASCWNLFLNKALLEESGCFICYVLLNDVCLSTAAGTRIDRLRSKSHSLGPKALWVCWRVEIAEYLAILATTALFAEAVLSSHKSAAIERHLTSLGSRRERSVVDSFIPGLLVRVMT